MNVLAKRKPLIWILYLLVLLACGWVLITSKETLTFLLLLLMVALAGFILVQYFITPKVMISVDSNEALHLHNGTVIQATDIVDVSYKRASARTIQYKWGKVILTTVQGSYTFRYVEDCEEVSKKILDIKYKNKYQNQELSFEDVLN